MKTFTIAAAAIAACMTGIAATPAVAAEEVRVEILYHDLDIASPAGATVLADRIAASVRQVCAPADARSLKEAAASAACQDQMVSNAVEQLNSKGATLAAGNLSAKG